MIEEQRESVLVAYDPKHKTAAEIWSVDGTMFADVPGEAIVEGINANEVLKAAVQSDRILVRRLRC